MDRLKPLISLSLGLITLSANLTFAAEFKPGEVIVKYKEGVSRPRIQMNQFYDSLGVKKIHRFSSTMKGFEHLIFDENLKVQDAITEIQKNPLVEYAQPNYILRISPVRTIGDDNPPGAPALPCIPGMDLPNCNPKLCLLPGVQFPPGCEDWGGGGGGGGNPPPGGGGGGGGNPPPANRPALQPAPAEVNPPVADPDLAKAWGLEKIGAQQAWTTYKGNKDFIVADIDTGIDYNHEDLAFNVWRNPNPTQNDVVGFDFIHNDGLPFDDNEHGTHTAGTIGAVGGNGKAISGVTQRVSIMSLKFLSGEGSGTTTDAIRSIDYAIEHGAKVLSNSWGGQGDDDNKALYSAIERAKVKDVLFVAAAGNDGADNDNASHASYPAAFDNDNLLSVAATDQNDRMAFFSNYGKKTTHVAAPGVNVYSTTPGNKYASLSGTSMAAPHVSGAAALIWSKNPTWNYKKVKEVLMQTVDQLPSLKGKVATEGRINVSKALQAR